MAFIIWTLKKNSSEANLTLVYILYEFKFPLNIRQFGAWWIHLFKHRKIFAKNKITESKKKERKSVCVYCILWSRMQCGLNNFGIYFMKFIS